MALFLQKSSIVDVWQGCKGSSPKFVCNITQSAFTCSKLTIETLERGDKYVQSGVVLVSLLLQIFTPYSGVSFVNFEHVIADWVGVFKLIN